MADPIIVDWWMLDEINNNAYPNNEKNPNNEEKIITPHRYYIREWNRWIQFNTEYEKSNERVHYEMCSNGYLALHFEGYPDPKLQSLSEYLSRETRDDEDLEWTSWNDYSFGCCKYKKLFISNKDEFKTAIRDFTAKMDKLILDYKKIEKFLKDMEIRFSKESVSLVDNLSLADIFHMPVNIPEYQRIYCWEEKNVTRLLDDIITDFKGKYRMGAIIFHRYKDEDTGEYVYNIVDGQQRLVTLSLILRKLGYETSPLLKKKFGTKEARGYIAYNRSIIDGYIDRYIDRNVSDPRLLAKKLLNSLEFSALIINTDNIDLAYTFFSNENSRGKSLSDFDLLKAHHLRYVSEEEQAEYLANNWDRMLSDANNKYDNDSEKPYYRSLGMYVFRLRHWMSGGTWDDFAQYKIKNEYEAAPIIDKIPPFGEKFYFNEAIQGGPHFFAFVKQFEYRFNEFAKTDEYKAIHQVSSRTHWWFRDVIETLLFGYYLKFGVEYLSEALVGISRIVLQYRYDTGRANYSRLLRQAGDSGIMAIIDRATSPTFVLADLQRKVKMLFVPPDLKNISKELRLKISERLSEQPKDASGNHRPSILEKIIIEDFKQFII